MSWPDAAVHVAQALGGAAAFAAFCWMAVKLLK